MRRNASDYVSDLGPDGRGCEICSGHSARRQCDRNPHEVYQEDRRKSPSRGRVTETKRSFPQPVRVSFGQGWVTRGKTLTRRLKGWMNWTQNICSIFISCFFFYLCCLEKNAGNSKRTATLYTIETQRKITTQPCCLEYLMGKNKFLGTDLWSSLRGKLQ